MPRANSWSDLKIGLIAFVSIVVVCIGVLVFARIGALHGTKTRLYLVTREANQVLKGTQVWLGGRQIGVVSDVEFRPVSSDTSERMLIAMDILSQYVGQIRRHAGVRIHPGSGLIGEPVVEIGFAPLDAPAVHDGDTLHAFTQFGRRTTEGVATRLGDSIVAIANQVRAITLKVHRTGMDVDTIRRRSERQMTAVGRAIERFSQRATQSHGTVASLQRDTALHTAVERLWAQSDSIRTVMTSGRGSLGRFRRDSTWFRDAAHVLASADTLQSTLRARFAVGPVSRADSALPKQLNRMQRSLDSLVQDVKRHPLKYLF